jgi:pyruvate dehydrogenase E2 component (dihydrolipoamide acetyltransferase)
MEFRVPELGEGIDQAVVIAVLVKPGDTVRAGQEVVEVETEKASMPVPILSAGTVDQVMVKTGDKVKVGTVLLSLSNSSSPSKKSEPTPAAATKKKDSITPAPTGSAQAETKDGASRHVEFHLPELGEGVDSGTVVGIAVKAGQPIAADQTIIEIETEKATIPVPSNIAGKVESIRVRIGQKISVGTLVAVIATESATAAAKTTPVPAAKPANVDGRQPPQPHHATPVKPVETPPRRPGAAIPAGPATRRLARELGIDLTQVTGTAPGGRVTQDDVKAHVRNRSHQPAADGQAVTGGITVPALPDFSKFGPIEKKPFTGLRKAIAKNLTVAWSQAPQVTQHDLADITDLEASRKRVTEHRSKDAPKVTMTVIAVKACVAALKAMPHFNASYNPSAGEYGELILKQYYHIGIAVDTERGLVVPVLRDADRKGIRELAKELSELAAKAKDGKLSRDDMRGGTFTISNLGGIGGTAFSPIVNYPEVAILGLSRSTWQPVVRDGKIEPRLMLPLSLTYDHRVIDGADGARFTTLLVSLLSEPGRLLMES